MEITLSFLTSPTGSRDGDGRRAAEYFGAKRDWNSRSLFSFVIFLFLNDIYIGYIAYTNFFVKNNGYSPEYLEYS